MGETVTLNITKEEWDSFRLESKRQSKDVSELCLILKGKPEAKIIGVVDKVEKNERAIADLIKAVDEVVDARKQQKVLMIGVGIGIALNFVTGAATLASISKILSAIATTGIP